MLGYLQGLLCHLIERRSQKSLLGCSYCSLRLLAACDNIDFMKPISYFYFVKNPKTVSLIAVKYFGKEAGVVQEVTDVIAGSPLWPTVVQKRY